MAIHKTLAGARAERDEKTHMIAEIEHVTEGRCFVRITVGFPTFKKAVDAKKIPQVLAAYAGYDKRSDEEIAAETAEILARVNARLRCDRCGVKVDGNTCYHQEEWSRLGGSRIKVRVHYCDSCAGLLKTIGAGEYTAMQERSGEVPSDEPETYRD